MQTLVTEYANDPSVVIARCNVAEEDIPVEIYHFPTVKLYPAGKKKMPVEYFGKYDGAKQLKTFIFNESLKGERVKAASRRNSNAKVLEDGERTGELEADGGIA
jgi:hypothetical protein